MDIFIPWAVGIGLTSVLTLLIVAITKIIIVKMVIKGVPVKKRAEVLIAASYFFSFRRERGARNELERSRDGPPDDTG